MFMGGGYDCVSAAEKINPYPVAKKFMCCSWNLSPSQYNMLHTLQKNTDHH